MMQTSDTTLWRYYDGHGYVELLLDYWIPGTTLKYCQLTFNQDMTHYK